MVEMGKTSMDKNPPRIPQCLRCIGGPKKIECKEMSTILCWICHKNGASNNECRGNGN